jgi:hypothetical protein
VPRDPGLASGQGAPSPARSSQLAFVYTNYRLIIKACSHFIK